MKIQFISVEAAKPVKKYLEPILKIVEDMAEDDNETIEREVRQNCHIIACCPTIFCFC